MYRDREADDEFRRDWEDAIEAGTDRMEDEMLRRAVEGVDEPIYQGGKKAGTVKRYSDTLMIFSLKARRPEKYRDNSKTDINITGDLVTELLAANKRVADK